MPFCAANFLEVKDALAQAALAAGRNVGEVRLLAVSKAQSPAALRAVYALGQRDFGENYAQEMLAKAAALSDLPQLRFIFIGGLQSNKIGSIVRVAAGIQSLASMKHARLIASQARALGKLPYPVHLLVNSGGELTKQGLSFAEVESFAATLAAELPELIVQGVMAIPPPLASATLVPPLYRRLREVADHVGAGDLSLGMSSDLALAVAAGSNCVRIGTAIFGARAAKSPPSD